MNPQPFRPCPHCGSMKHAVRFIVIPFYIVRCAECSLLFLGNPMEDSTSIDVYHDGPEPQAGLYRAGGPHGFLSALYAMNETRIRMIRSVKSGGTLLDVGCGRGYFVKTASDGGFDAMGIDLSEKAVRYARETFKVTADTASMETLLRSGRTFEVVTLWHALEHFDDPISALTIVRSLLSEGGICVIEVPNLNSLKFILSGAKWEGGNHPLYHRTFFTVSTLRRVLEKAGFSSIRRIQLNYSFPGRNRFLSASKVILNLAGLDSFLDFIAFK
jgi:2-polyprenyl-3-methyl-5-hydroxy-6-metoxy-1,4-benzoquinol methylase